MTGFASPGPFEARAEVSGGRQTLVLNGELDIVSAGQLEAMLAEACADGTTGVTLDLRGLTFMDSSGLRAILLAKELTDSRGLDLAVIPGPPSIQRVFDVTALLDVLPWTDATAARPAEEPFTPTEAGS
jgi:anti-sigma B factor antagonist